MGPRVRVRLFHLHFVMDFLFPLLKNSKSGVDDRGHRLRITHTRVAWVILLNSSSSLKSSIVTFVDTPLNTKIFSFMASAE